MGRGRGKEKGRGRKRREKEKGKGRKGEVHGEKEVEGHPKGGRRGKMKRRGRWGVGERNQKYTKNLEN